MPRISAHRTFMNIAIELSNRATCNRARVGCVLVRDKRIISTGYNGAPRGKPHCKDVGCLMIGGHCLRCVHSEANAIITAARHGVSTLGADCYCTLLPCLSCYNLLDNAGIVDVYYSQTYSHSEQAEIVKAMPNVHPL